MPAFSGRVLLLAVAAATLGATAVLSAAALPTGSDATDPSASVGVTTPVGGASFTAEVEEIPANGVAQRVADVIAHDADTDYQLRVESGGLAVSNQGVTEGVCGTIGATPYSVVDDVALPHDFTWNFGPTQKVGELHLTIPVDAGNNCLVRKAVVTVTFTAIGPDVDVP